MSLFFNIIKISLIIIILQLCYYIDINNLWVQHVDSLQKHLILDLPQHNLLGDFTLESLHFLKLLISCPIFLTEHPLSVYSVTKENTLFRSEHTFWITYETPNSFCGSLAVIPSSFEVASESTLWPTRLLQSSRSRSYKLFIAVQFQLNFLLNAPFHVALRFQSYSFFQCGSTIVTMLLRQYYWDARIASMSIDQLKSKIIA